MSTARNEHVETNAPAASGRPAEGAQASAAGSARAAAGGGAPAAERASATTAPGEKGG